MPPQSENGTRVRTYWNGYIPSWYKLVPKLRQFQLLLPAPDLLVIHLQIREMNPKSTEELLVTIQRSLAAIRNLFPQCLIVWSDFLHEPRTSCSEANVDQAVDGFYDVVNGRVHAMIADLGGATIGHGNIRPEHYNLKLNHRNGKRLESSGVKIFKTNIRNFVFKWEWKVSPTSEGVSCPTTKQQVRKSNESPVKENQTHGSSAPITGFAPCKFKTVWICGGCLVAAVSKKMQLPTYGSALGPDRTRVRMYWSREPIQLWKRLVHQLSVHLETWPSPDMLIIHMRDDIIPVKEDLVNALSVIKKDLTSVHNTFPQCRIVWSDILPKYSKKQGTKPMEILSTRHDAINDGAHAIVAELGGRFVSHKNIRIDHYRHKGNSLTCAGANLFKTNIEAFLNEWAMGVTPAPNKIQFSFKQQVKESNESPVKENQTHGSSAPITAPATIIRPPKTVWMCGDALTDLAQWLTSEPPRGVKTSSNSMKVFQVTTWSALVVEMTSVKRKHKWRRPDLLLVHLGVNNNVTNPTHLLNTIRKDLARLHGDYPRCLIAWSDMLPACAPKALGARPSSSAGRINDAINRGAHAIVAELGGRVLSHENIGPELSSPDGSALSAQGIERLKLNLRQFLQEWEREGEEQKPAN
ncbi:uncharacterized protein LOC134063571 isoform X2 [Sardina pilchardus]|uniref:uncharacterized protein LOC134063571 isoform X2 n=1 Tax=Sardina pilchardus TaxID=27697 RepID=UPI002E112C79